MGQRIAEDLGGASLPGKAAEFGAVGDLAGLAEAHDRVLQAGREGDERGRPNETTGPAPKLVESFWLNEVKVPWLVTPILQ